MPVGDNCHGEKQSMAGGIRTDGRSCWVYIFIDHLLGASLRRWHLNKNLKGVRGESHGCRGACLAEKALKMHSPETRVCLTPYCDWSGVSA